MSYAAKILSTRQGNTFVIASGNQNSPALILLHGASSNALTWLGDVPEYSRHFRVYAVDMPGEPGKSSQNRPSFQDLSYSEWLYDIFNGLNIQKACLAGLSQGGWTALRFSSSYPERIAKLVLLAPAGVVPTKASFILKAVSYSLLGPYGAKRINRMVFGKQEIHPDIINFMDLIMTHFRPRIEKEYIFTDAELKKLSMPVLLIGGAEDVIRSAEAIAARMSRSVQRLQTLIIPDMGHVLINQTQTIIPFLKNTV